MALITHVIILLHFVMLSGKEQAFQLPSVLAAVSDLLIVLEALSDKVPLTFSLHQPLSSAK